MKIAYIGIDALYPALPALEEAGWEIREVITCETDNVTEFNLQVQGFAQRRGIPLPIGRITSADLKQLKAQGCQAVVCGGYYYRLPVDGELPMVNIHPSLLPVGRGGWPMPSVILRGLTETGVTVHKITPEFDQGDILLQTVVPVSPGENLQTLTAKMQALLPGMMAELAGGFQRLYDSAVPQGEGEYWPCPREEDYPITPDTPFEEAERVLRAFYGYECVYQRGGKRYGLINAAACPGGQGRFPIRDGTVQAEKVRELP